MRLFPHVLRWAIDVVSWLIDGSVESLRSGLRRVAPELASGRIVLHDWIEQSHPRWWSASATVEGRVVVKYA